MIVLPNPFMNSADDTPSVESAAAPIDQPRSAAAVAIAESFTTTEVNQEAPAAAASPVDAGATDPDRNCDSWDINGTDCIGEIFARALAESPDWALTGADDVLYETLKRQDRQQTRDLARIPDARALMEAIDDRPLFLRDDTYLRRRA